MIEDLNNSPSDALGGLKPSAFKSIWDSYKLDQALPRASREPNYHIQLRNQKKYIANKRKPLQRGTFVLLDNTKQAFDKVSDWQRSPQVYVISEVRAYLNPPLFLLRSLDNEPVLGYYYSYQLKVTSAPSPNALFIQEKFLATRVRKGRTEHLVKFLGYSNKYNQWIDKDNLVSGPDKE